MKMREQTVRRRVESELSGGLETSGVKSVLIAVSGGADSVALLSACSRLSPHLGLKIEVVNCNFHLRGEESNRDSEFTAGLCLKLGIRLHKIDYDVDSYIAGHPGTSIEMACRELRYTDFFRIAKERGLDRVATAHNADDDIETMMLNMLRGSGTRGLRGMDKDNGRVIRPLIGITRTEIESYLSSIGQTFITDSSNLTNDYRRNYIRHDVLPLIENRWPGSRKTLSRTLSIIKEESEIVESHYRRQLQTLCPDPTTLLVYADGVTTGTVMRFIERFGGNTSTAEEIMESLGREFGERKWQLSDRYTGILERDRLIITDSQKTGEEPILIWETIKMNPELMSEIKRNRSHDIIFLPHDESEYELRRPQTGDRMSPLGMRGTRLISDIISDARLDSRRKHAIRVLVRRNDNEIIWVTGLKRSRHDLIDPNADFIHQATFVNFTDNPDI